MNLTELAALRGLASAEMQHQPGSALEQLTLHLLTSLVLGQARIIAEAADQEDFDAAKVEKLTSIACKLAEHSLDFDRALSRPTDPSTDNSKRPPTADELTLLRKELKLL